MIDIMSFCATPGSFKKTKIETPWSRGDYTYATNGHIGIRVPRRPDVTDEHGPDLQKIIDGAPLSTNLRPMPEFDLNSIATRLCFQCKGSGKTTWCRSCDGEGEIECCECGQGRPCENCNGEGTRPAKKDDDKWDVCYQCSGIGRVPATDRWPPAMIADKLCINILYARLIATLPSARIDLGCPADGSAIRFVFDGGDGVVMPMRWDDGCPFMSPVTADAA